MATDTDRLASFLTIDLTTKGRKSGLPRTVEIWWFRVDGRFVITGTPGPRHWMANIVAKPRVTITVGGEVIEATAEVVEDAEFRRRVFLDPATRWYLSQSSLQELVDEAPMVEVHFQ